MSDARELEVGGYITEEMVEQYALRVHLWMCEDSWDDECRPYKGRCVRAAEIALTAAVPEIVQAAKAEALREAADQLDAYSPRDNPVPYDPRWACDLGYYGEAAWLRARADCVSTLTTWSSSPLARTSPKPPPSSPLRCPCTGSQAEAWGEGHAAGCTDPYAKYGECDCGPNPYRERGES